MKAKRLSSGEYEYRGYLILDHGEGRSVHAATMRASARWSVKPMIDTYYHRGPTGLHWIPWKRTLKDAKHAIDMALPAPDGFRYQGPRSHK